MLATIDGEHGTLGTGAINCEAGCDESARQAICYILFLD
jgi:hypothetical protein